MNDKEKTDEDKEAKQKALGVAWIVIILGVGYFWMTREGDTSGGSNSGPSQAENRCEDTDWAYVMSHAFVEQELRSPSTADFPFTSETGVNINYLGNCRHRVNSYVDAQNGFGATVRQNYTAELRYNERDDTWTLESLDMP